ncbi:unnamed protein product [Cuscuta campestris]|uniref:Uncharacterized protein n=1 Tax=Cuscuta campestris TaxID=132261 RepID=A0A484NEK8_9ASTE|nr:unnamed protein product [Cuscuta campestris]
MYHGSRPKILHRKAMNIKFNTAVIVTDIAVNAKWGEFEEVEEEEGDLFVVLSELSMRKRGWEDDGGGGWAAAAVTPRERKQRRGEAEPRAGEEV